MDKKKQIGMLFVVVVVLLAALAAGVGIKKLLSQRSEAKDDKLQVQRQESKPAAKVKAEDAKETNITEEEEAEAVVEEEDAKQEEPVVAVVSHADLKTKLASPDYEVRRSAVTQLLHTGKQRPLTKEEIKLLLPPFKSDPDWRIKVRITAVLPFAADKTQVFQPLIDALRERDDDASGGGNLQLYSCMALAEIGDQRALPAMREWLGFLESHPKRFKSLRDALIKMTKQRIKELEDKADR